jgi:hypothetical protein
MADMVSGPRGIPEVPDEPDVDHSGNEIHPEEIPKLLSFQRPSALERDLKA